MLYFCKSIRRRRGVALFHRLVQINRDIHHVVFVENYESVNGRLDVTDDNNNMKCLLVTHSSGRSARSACVMRRVHCWTLTVKIY